MPRFVSAALGTALAQPVTAVGYLLQWNFEQVARWCNIGDVTVGGNIFAKYDFNIDGLVQDPDSDFQCRVTVENLDNAAAALFIASYTPDLTVDIWQFERSATALNDVPKFCTLTADALTISPEKMEVSLISSRVWAAYSPRRRVDSTYGFNRALPEGKQIVWGNETFIVDAEQNSDG